MAVPGNEQTLEHLSCRIPSRNPHVLVCMDQAEWRTLVRPKYNIHPAYISTCAGVLISLHHVHGNIKEWMEELYEWMNEWMNRQSDLPPPPPRYRCSSLRFEFGTQRYTV